MAKVEKGEKFQTPLYSNEKGLGYEPVGGPTGGKSVPDPLGYIKAGGKK